MWAPSIIDMRTRIECAHHRARPMHAPYALQSCAFGDISCSAAASHRPATSPRASSAHASAGHQLLQPTTLHEALQHGLRVRAAQPLQQTGDITRTTATTSIILLPFVLLSFVSILQATIPPGTQPPVWVVCVVLSGVVVETRGKLKNVPNQATRLCSHPSLFHAHPLKHLKPALRVWACFDVY